MRKLIRFIDLKRKTILRCSLALITALTLIIGYTMLNDYVIVDGASTYYLHTSDKDALTAMRAAGISVRDDDALKYASDNGETVVTLDRSYSQIVTPQMRLAASQLAKHVVSYTDELIFGSHEVLSYDMHDNSFIGARNFNVVYEYETVKQTVKFGYKTVYSDSLELGKSTVEKGVNGEKEIVYLNKVINGIVVSREKYGETVTSEPKAQVETIGTKRIFNSANAVQTSDDVKCISTLHPSKPIELDANGIPVAYSKVITGKATAYYQGKYCATGVEARPGYIAVNPSQIPYGTRLYIVSADGKYVYGYAIAADTGGFAKNGSGTIADLRFNTKSECYAFGRRTVNIYVLD